MAAILSTRIIVGPNRGIPRSARILCRYLAVLAKVIAAIYLASVALVGTDIQSLYL